MNPEIIAPLVMGFALMWWVGQHLSWAARIAVTATTLLLVGAIIALEGSWR